MYFVGNPFVEQVEAYRIWTISNCAKLIDLDGEKVTAAEKRSRIKDPPAVVKEAKSMEDHEEYLGKKVTPVLRLMCSWSPFPTSPLPTGQAAPVFR